MKANAEVKIDAVVTSKSAIKVTIDTARPSFFFNLLPLGGFTTHAESEAEGLALGPLCVVTLGKGDHIKMADKSKLQAPNCLIHSNQDVEADGGGLVQGFVVEASGSASGPISPSASTGAPILDDPFASLPVDTSACAGKLPTDKVEDGEVLTLAPGLHTENYDIRNGGTLALSPGEHTFCGVIKLSTTGNIAGNDVVLVLDEKAKLDWKDGGNVSLSGRTSGPLAGFVIVVSRTDKDDFELNSDPITNVTGAIYVPNAKLKVDGSKRAASSSAWTVVAARGFEARDGANLVINSDYAGSSVPVPGGVGNKNGTARLVK